MARLYTDPQTGWLLPVEGGVITQGYGPENTDPSVRALYRKGYHTGIDISGVPEGTPIVSPTEATVSLAGVNGGYGNCVILDRDDGVAMVFGHLSTIAVQVGQRVAAGQELGGIGNTGVSTGVHLHYEYRRNGEDIDPTPFLQATAPPTGLRATAKEALNLREGPGKDSRLLGTAPAGTEVTLGWNGWYPVWWDGREGWMYGEFLDIRTDGAAPGPPAAAPGGEGAAAGAAPAPRTAHTTDRSNLRSGPGMEFPVLTVLNLGSAVEVLGEQGEWLQVNAGGQQGFVHGSLLAVDGRPTPNRPGRTTASPNLRSGPSMEFPVLRVLPPGVSLEVLDDQGPYLRVIVDGIQGFVHRDFVALDAQGVASGFLRSRPDLATVPLEPPEGQRIVLDAGAGDAEQQVAGAWNRYGGLLTVLSNELRIDPAVAVAVLAIEAGGRGLDPQGRLIIRFENHIFFNHWGQSNPDAFAQHFNFNPAHPWQDHQWRPSAEEPWREQHKDQGSEWEPFQFACTLDDAAAKASISMGAPQIMGFNCTAIGCESAPEMFDAFCAGERNQIIGFFDFVGGADSNSPRVLALQRQDFFTFAALYNGTGQVATYGSLMGNAFDTFRRLRPVQ